MPSITRTRASPVPKSRIARRVARPVLDSTRRSPSGGGTGRRRCRGGGRRGTRWRSAGARRSRGPGPTAEEAEEIPLRSQHERGVAAVKRLAICLQRSVEGEELLVLAEGVAIELHGLG